MNPDWGPKPLRGDPAVLVGTVEDPVIEMRFERKDRHATTGVLLGEWVKDLPGRRWNKAKTCWEVRATGPGPATVIGAAGFTSYFVDLDDPFVTSLDDVTKPLVQVCDKEGWVSVLPRLTGFKAGRELLGGSAVWIGGENRWELPIDALPRPGLEYGDGVVAAIGKARRLPDDVKAAAATLAASVDMDQAGADGDTVLEAVGDVPAWFGLQLDGYQRAGAIAAVAGHRVIADEPGLGKGSPSWVKILTPTGWTTYGEVQVGDQVVGSNGKPTSVIGVYPRGELEVFKVTMSDGSSVVVDGDHLWSVQTSNQRFKDSFGRTLSTREIMESDLSRSYGGVKENMNFIPMVEPVQFEHGGERPLDPYLLGVLLGDGSFTNRSVSISSGDPEVFDLCSDRCPDGVTINLWAVGEGRPQAAGVTGSPGRTNPVTSYLRSVGLMGRHSFDKFVPEAYLFAPADDRLELLRGLMDTDGTAGAAASFSSTSPKLAEAVEFLVRSLGGVTHTGTKDPWYVDRGGARVQGRRAYNVSVTLDPQLCPFRIKRKVEAWVKPWKYRPLRSIRSIEPVGREEVTCIAVDADDQLYVTEDFIVTHNTRTSLAAAAIVGAKRIVVTCPPSTLTGWMREASSSKLADWTTFALDPETDAGSLGAGSTERGDAPPTKTRPVDPGAGESLADRPPLAVPDGYISPRVVAFRSGRKEPELPEAGIVIVPDSLLQKRPKVLAKLIDWKPDAVICDEAHRAKTFWSARAKVLRRMAQAARKLPLALTGTTLFANTFELAGVLDIAGHLGPTFGGFDGFVAKFCKEGRFGGFVTNKKMLAELKAVLDAKVWVRRVKSEVAKDLPAKRRVPKIVDIDLSSYKAAHAEVIDVIDTWIDDHVAATGELPKMAEVEAWAKHEVSLVARLRKAAGLAKIPAAVEWVTNFVTTHADPDDETFDRPLIVWAHHTEVADALIAAVPAKFPAAGVIVGSTSGPERARVIDAYQAGQIPVLVASIHAASVGITLTRGCDALVVEADVTPAIMAQLEDRQCRRGQTRPVTVTTMVAPGTFDMRVQAILGSKGEVLDHLHVGADDDVAVVDVNDDDVLRPFELICELAVERLEAARRRHRRKAA